MIGRLCSDLRQGLDLARPKTLATLWKAGAFDLRGAVGLATSWPWLLGRGASLGVVSQLNRVALPEKTAVIDRSGSVTWGELDRRANRFVHAMRGLGLTPWDHVAFVLRNGREIVEGLLGAQKGGLVAAPLNTWAKPKELSATLGQANPTALVYDVQHASQVRQAASEGVTLIAVGDAADPIEGSLRYEELLAKQSDSQLPPLSLRRGSPKVVIHTSGTSGTPKGASRDAAASGVRELTWLLRTVPFRRDDIILSPAPLFHSFGLLTLVLGGLLGATFVLPGKFDPEGTLALIEEHRVTVASMSR